MSLDCGSQLLEEMNHNRIAVEPPSGDPHHSVPWAFSMEGNRADDTTRPRFSDRARGTGRGSGDLGPGIFWRARAGREATEHECDEQ